METGLVTLSIATRRPLARHRLLGSACCLAIALGLMLSMPTKGLAQHVLRAQDPTPHDGRQGVIPGFVFRWDAPTGIRPVAYNLYMDTDKSRVHQASPACEVVALGLGESEYASPRDLSPYETIYYWRVDAVDETAATQPGSVWEFRTLPEYALGHPDIALYKRVIGSDGGSGQGCDIQKLTEKTQDTALPNCVHTQAPADDPWYQVDLDQEVTVAQVAIRGREDTAPNYFGLSGEGNGLNLTIYRDDGATVAYDLRDANGGALLDPVGSIGHDIILPKPVQGRYVRVTGVGKDVTFHPGRVSVYSAEPPDLRISWDYTRRSILTDFVDPVESKERRDFFYARTKRIRNGDILQFFQLGQWSWWLGFRRSIDNGKTWTDPIIIKQSWFDDATGDYVCYCSPEFLQLANGDILFVYQRRNNTMKMETDGIEVMRSEDNGHTWGNPIWAYRGVNWEPFLLETPKGVLQLYFTDNTFGGVGLVQSHDGGRTWHPQPGPPYQAPFISWAHGMPTAVVLDGDLGIAMATELGRDSSPTITWTPNAGTWETRDVPQPVFGDAVSLDRSMMYPAARRWALHLNATGAAPYLAKLPTGEVVGLYNGTYSAHGDTKHNAIVLIGDRSGRHFGRASSPAIDAGAWWGSIQYCGDDGLLYSSHYNAGQMNLISVFGKINRPLAVPRQHRGPRTTGDDNWARVPSWFISRTTAAAAEVQMTYDNDSLYLHWVAKDESVDAQDGFSMSLDPASQRSHVVLPGMYRVTALVDGSVRLEKAVKGRTWIEVASDDLDATVTLSSSDDRQPGYTIDVVLPWSVLGGRPGSGQRIGAHLRLHNGVDGKAVVESMDGEYEASPATWSTVRLIS